MPRSYAPEFRRRVIELCRVGGRPSEIAEGAGVSEATVYRWIAQEEVDLGERSGVRSGERVELSRARARIRELEGELELTRKASALFEEQEERRVVRPKGSTR
jgi:transposase-like protein